MRRTGIGSLKGKNKWVRPVDNPTQPAATEPPIPSAPTATTAPQVKPLKKVGKYALSRATPTQPSRKALPPTNPVLPRRKPGVDRSRFKYERSKDESAAAAVGASSEQQLDKALVRSSTRSIDSKDKPLVKPITAQASVQPQRPTATSSSKAVAMVRPGKLRWNKYVRESLGGNPEEAPPAAAAAAALEEKKEKPSAAKPTPLSELRRSKRIQSAAVASPAANKLLRKGLGQRTQRAMQLLRLNGRLYSVGGQRGKGRSLTLKAVLPSSAPASEQQTEKPSISTKAASKPVRPASAPASTSTAAAALMRQKSGRSIGLSKPRKIDKRPPKPGSRLKGGRVVYCPVYCHTGRCPKRGRGCPLRHDPTKRAVCQLWLKGRCALGGACPLQHQRRPELMPACVHFLQGRCTNPDCPYLHVTLRPDAPHCAAFLRGYCAAGVKCASKHYTLKQIKEERKLIAGNRPGKKTKRAKRESDGDQAAAGGGASDAPKEPKKKRRRRYFDDFSQGSFEEEQQGAEEEEEEEVSENSSSGEEGEEEESGGSGDDETSSDGIGSEEAGEDSEDDGSTSSSTGDDDNGAEVEDHHPEPASLEDFIGFD